jgi:hypothetical protein
MVPLIPIKWHVLDKSNIEILERIISPMIDKIVQQEKKINTGKPKLYRRMVKTILLKYIGSMNNTTTADTKAIHCLGPPTTPQRQTIELSVIYIWSLMFFYMLLRKVPSLHYKGRETQIGSHNK